LPDSPDTVPNNRLVYWNPATERIARYMGLLESLIGQEFLERTGQNLDQGTSAHDQIVRLAVARQVYQDQLTLFGELVAHRVPGLPAMPDPCTSTSRGPEPSRSNANMARPP
jgi:hypothetical protein